jgi:hypothetical protein
LVLHTLEVEALVQTSAAALVVLVAEDLAETLLKMELRIVVAEVLVDM